MLLRNTFSNVNHDTNAQGWVDKWQIDRKIVGREAYKYLGEPFDNFILYFIKQQQQQWNPPAIQISVTVTATDSV